MPAGADWERRRAMKISILQPQIAIGGREANIAAVRRLLEQAVAEGADTILLPELWDIGFYPRPLEDYADPDGTRAREVLAELAVQYRVDLVGGSVAAKLADGVHNRCYVFSRTGELLAHYDKVHLFSPAKENRAFVPGRNLAVFSLGGVKCGVIVCYDLRFPELARRLALEDIAVLFIPAAWPTVRLAHWRLLSQARAVENQCFVAAANGSGSFANGIELAGHSLLIDPWGNCLAEAGTEEAVITAVPDFPERDKIKRTIDVFADRRPEMYGSPAGD